MFDGQVEYRSGMDNDGDASSVVCEHVQTGEYQYQCMYLIVFYKNSCCISPRLAYGMSSRAPLSLCWFGQMAGQYIYNMLDLAGLCGQYILRAYWRAWHGTTIWQYAYGYINKNVRHIHLLLYKYTQIMAVYIVGSDEMRRTMLTGGDLLW